MSVTESAGDDLLHRVATTRQRLGDRFHEQLMAVTYAEASRLTDRAVTLRAPGAGARWDHRLDRILTSRTFGFPVMALLFALVFWITIVGANVPSAALSHLLLQEGHPFLRGLAVSMGAPSWLTGLLIDGCYLATAWVVAVMLPPMAIFFPLFTLLEDLGYLPRVAFNLDPAFKRNGAHGKQCLTMMMGFGCNAAGVISTRIIDSPRERLIAILTNNFALCNGRWPAMILIATLFVGSRVPPHLAALAAAGVVVSVALLGIGLTLLVSRGLSRTVLKGEPSAFSLELPPYRPPRVWQTIYTSFIDRTLFVLWRAVLFAAPAGALIWLIANVQVDGVSVAEMAAGFLDPMGVLIGLNGIILLAYIIAIPANEIVIPTVLMVTALTAGLSGVGEGPGVLFELDSLGDTLAVFEVGGFTLLTAVNLMLFSLIHNPCSTTLFTIYRETGSGRWTALAGLLPLGLGLAITFVVAQVWRLLGGAG